MSLVVMDDKYRVLLDKGTREIAGLEKGDTLVAIPFKGGVILVCLKGKGFRGSLNDFHYDEGRHEASRYLFKEEATHAGP